MTTLTREQMLGAVVAGGGLVAATTLLDGVAESAPSAAQDMTILNFALQLEELQAAYYAEVLRQGRLTGEARQYATVVGAHEREHVAYLRKALGSKARPAPRYAFGAAASDPSRFLDTGRQLEDLALHGYNAGAPNLTPAALAAAARIVSVEARHAAWIRDIAGVDPAPDASEPTRTPTQVANAIRDTGFVQR